MEEEEEEEEDGGGVHRVSVRIDIEFNNINFIKQNKTINIGGCKQYTSLHSMHHSYPQVSGCAEDVRGVEPLCGGFLLLGISLLASVRDKLSPCIFHIRDVLNQRIDLTFFRSRAPHEPQLLCKVPVDCLSKKTPHNSVSALCDKRHHM